MDEQRTIVPGFKPVIKSTNSYCIITNENIFHPSVILELNDDTAKIKFIRKSNFYWKWSDILEYRWVDVVGRIERPIKVSKTKNIYRVPELDM